MRIAFFTPLTPLQTAIADHSEGLLPHMVKHAQIDLFIDDGYRPTNPLILAQSAVYNYREFPAWAQDYDLVVYVMGDNADFHGYMYEILQRYPGVVILHDVVLHHFIVGLTLARGDVEGYLREMRYAYGKKGAEAAQRVIAGRGDDVYATYPLVERVLDASLGVIVHNHFAKRDLLARRPNAKVACINYHFYLPYGFPDQVDATALRAQLGVKDRFVLATFGLFIPDKRIDVCLRVFSRFLDTHPDATYLLVGSHSSYYDVPGMIRNLGLESKVILTGWMDRVLFVKYMFVPDIAIHLRYPHIGGTLYTPIRLLGLGVPTILSDIETLAEISEGCCAKIAPDVYEEETLLATLEYLATHEDVRRKMGENGRQFIWKNHNCAAIARQYIDSFQEVLDSSAKPLTQMQESVGWETQLVRESAAILATWGITDKDDRLLWPVAAAIASLKGQSRKCVDRALQ